MEIILEWEEIERLLRKALWSEGIVVPPDAVMTVRKNHKGSRLTARMAFKTRKSASPEDEET